jgi:hypothetical protein
MASTKPFLLIVDPAKEQFTPFTVKKQGVTFYGLKGRNRSLLWARNAENNWKTELVKEIPASLKTNCPIQKTETGRTGAQSSRIYDPWKDQWTTVPIENGSIVLPAFLRSLVVIIG